MPVMSSRISEMVAYLMGFIHSDKDAPWIVVIGIPAGREHIKTDLVYTADLSLSHGQTAQVDDSEAWGIKIDRLISGVALHNF